MFTFLEEFNMLSDDKLTLKICEKVQGDNILLPFYYYDIYENFTNQCIGKISIRIGDNYNSYYNGHIGYEIDEDYRGKYYSYHAIMLVIWVAKAHRMESIYLTCTESNIASRKIIEKTNAKLIEIAKVPRNCFFWHVGIEDYCIYGLKL